MSARAVIVGLVLGLPLACFGWLNDWVLQQAYVAGDHIPASVYGLLLVGLEAFAKAFPHQLSGGMAQRVALARALVNDPDLLILDEPTSGLDPLGRMKVREIIQRLKNEGKTVFFSSHELGEVETVCDRVAIINQGELKVEGRVADLVEKHQANLEQIFLKIIGYQAQPSA